MASPNKTRVQVATDPAFSNVIHDVEGAYTTALQIAEDILPKGINLYTRGMHGHPTTGDSSWSTTVQFQIKLAWSDWDGSANGIEYALNSGNGYYPSSVLLSTNKVLISYVNGSQGNKLYSMILTISGTAISFTSPVKCNDTVTGFLSSAKLSENKVIVAYVNGSDSNCMYALLLNIINDVITPTVPVKHANYALGYVSITALSETKAVVCMPLNVNVDCMYGMVLSVNGDVITAGAIVQCTPHTSWYISAVAISDTKVFVTYTLADPYRYVYGILLSINGTVITAGTPLVCVNSPSINVAPIVLDANRILICYSNFYPAGNDYSLRAVLVTVNESVLSAGAPVVCNSIYSLHDIGVLLSENNVLVSYLSTDMNLYSQVITVENDDLLVGDPVLCNSGPSGGWGEDSISIANLNIDDGVLAMYNKGTNTQLYAKVLVG